MSTMRGMTEWISPKDFHAADGVDDWRVLAVSATAFFRTGSFAQSAALLGAIAAPGGDAPDVDVRPDGVTVRLMAGEHGLPAGHVEAARRISALARDHGVTADPTRPQDVQLALDALVTPAVRPFWCAVLGYDERGDEDAVDPQRIGPPIWFQDMDPPRTQRNRFHVDVFVPHDQLEARIAAGLAAGGRIVFDGNAPAGTTLADPEGNEVDIATWMGRD